MTTAEVEQLEAAVYRRQVEVAELEILMCGEDVPHYIGGMTKVPESQEVAEASTPKAKSPLQQYMEATDSEEIAYWKDTCEGIGIMVPPHPSISDTSGVGWPD